MSDILFSSGLIGPRSTPVICDGVDEAKARMSAIIARQFGNRRGISVLEAGGGSLSRVDLDDDAVVTVIDISREQLERNTYAAHKILGDLHTEKLPARGYDLIICWDVLEHLDDPALVFANFLNAIKPGGLIVVAAPNPNSLSGMITKFTPHWFHVLVLRHLFKLTMAGQPGYPPFPTFMRYSMYPEQLRRVAISESGDATALIYYESSRRAALRRKSPFVGRLYDLAIAACRVASFGRIRLELSDYIFLVSPTGQR